jgi:thiol-disulfide isomerase/thioredoxin
MDRLSALALTVAAVAVVACGKDRTDASGDPPSRVNAAKVGVRQGATTEAFCDMHATDDKGPAFVPPALANGGVLPAATGWRWVNVWATWCKPCVEEMPRLIRWRDKLAAAGKPFELAFISVDDSEDDVTAFRKLHPDAPASLRVAEPGNQGAWFKTVGLDGAPPIPVHVFVGPAGHVRCARAGGVREQDYGVVDKLLGE